MLLRNPKIHPTNIIFSNNVSPKTSNPKYILKNIGSRAMENAHIMTVKLKTGGNLEL